MSLFWRESVRPTGEYVGGVMMGLGAGWFFCNLILPFFVEHVLGYGVEYEASAWVRFGISSTIFLVLVTVGPRIALRAQRRGQNQIQDPN